MKVFAVIAIAACTWLAACSSSNKIKVVNGFDKQAHRGGRGLMPENTIPAMLHAIDLGVNTLEMDVVFSKDMQALVSHEPFFNHEISTRSNGEAVPQKEEKQLNIYQMNFPATQQFDVGLKVNPRFPDQQKLAVHKPLLSVLIDSAEAHSNKKIFYNIETKTQLLTDNIYHPIPAVFVNELMKIINEKGIGARTTIQSFDIRTLQYLHANYPNIKTALLVEADSKSSFRKHLKDLGFIPTIYSPQFALVTKDLVKECHKKHMLIIPWTVNEKDQMAMLRNLGVDGLITDYPDRF